MLGYWLLFALWAAGAIQFARRQRISTRLFWVAAGVTALMIGLRYEVGGDWENYLAIYDAIALYPLGTAIWVTDPAYSLLNWMSAQVEAGIWPANLICGALFMFGVGRLALRQPNAWLAILIAVPYFIVVVAMGYTRQAAAIGILCLVLADARQDNVLRTVVLIGFAALFHKTALVVLPLILAPVLRRNLLYAMLGGIAFLGLAGVLLLGSSDKLISGYVQSDLDSQGAFIRVSMNVLAAAIFLPMRRKFGFPPFINSFWTLAGYINFALLAALVAGAASAGVDRLALFLIPLQMVVFSRLPYLGRERGRATPSLLLAAVAYSAAVQFVWLNYADNARAWLPYSTVLTNHEF